MVTVRPQRHQGCLQQRAVVNDHAVFNNGGVFSLRDLSIGGLNSLARVLLRSLRLSHLGARGGEIEHLIRIREVAGTLVVGALGGTCGQRS